MVFQTEVFKHPRGFLRCIQWFFAMLAFSTCAGFYFSIDFSVKCKPIGNHSEPENVVNVMSYPFQLDHISKTNYTIENCFQDGNTTKSSLSFSVTYPNDYSSDSKFYVFIGVTCWLYCMATLYVYTYFSDIYEDPQRNFPLYDLIISAIFAFFWLASSSAWGHAVIGLKSVAEPENWIHDSISVCKFASGSSSEYENPHIESCKTNELDSFGGANVSVIIGFFNLFLWCANCWYLYKETKFFMPTSAENLQNVESPTFSA